VRRVSEFPTTSLRPGSVALVSLALTLLLTLLVALPGCGGRHRSFSTVPSSPTAIPTPPPSLSQPTAAARTGEPTAVQQEPGEEKQVLLTAEPMPTPSFPDLPDLTAPPTDGSPLRRQRRSWP
jgi:hypothetical protein